MAQRAKQLLMSRTMWLAFLMGVSGVAAAALATDPTLQSVGWFMIVKAVLDGWLRLNTSLTIK